MFSVDSDSAIPLSDQLKAGLKDMIARGLLRPGDSVPSARSLAAELKLNPEMVKRVLYDLSLAGVIESRGDEHYVSQSGGA